MLGAWMMLAAYCRPSTITYDAINEHCNTRAQVISEENNDIASILDQLFQLNLGYRRSKIEDAPVDNDASIARSGQPLGYLY